MKNLRKIQIHDGEVSIVFSLHQRSLKLTIVYHLIGILTGGIGYLILKWYPGLYIHYFTSMLLNNNDIVVYACNEWGQEDIIEMQVILYNGDASNAIPEGIGHVDYLYVFEYRHKRYVYYENEIICQEHWNHFKIQELTSVEVEQRLLAFRNNSIPIPNPKLISLLINEVLHPFYIFQIFSIVLWFIESYVYYACCIFIISGISISQSLYDTKSNIKRLQKLAINEQQVKVKRNGSWMFINATDMVIGDIYAVNGDLIPADSILIQGKCIVDECMLTGESVPVVKMETQEMIPVNLSDPMLTSSLQKHVLFNGTKCLQCQDESMAMVIRTGYKSCKGMLIRSILHPKPQSFKFYQDSMKFVAFLAFVAFLGFVYSVVQFIRAKESIRVILIAGLDIITIAIPPALPSTLTIGSSISLNRLKKIGIYCISPSKINVAGMVDFVLFDKTGTLTINSLLLKFVLNTSFSIIETPSEELKLVMCSCHTISTINNTLVGDPLEIEMVNFVKDKIKFTPLKVFEFDAELMRMSVFINYNNKLLLCTKGAPESIKSICTTIPFNFDEKLVQYSHKGYRVLAMAYKYVDILENRIEMEKEMTFCGFLVFENKLKKETATTITQLHTGNIHTAMCTGDNLLTAIAVAKECHILQTQQHIKKTADIELQSLVSLSTDKLLVIPKYTTDIIWEGFDQKYSTLDPFEPNLTFALDGTHFEIMKAIKPKEYITQIISNCSVFARMTPGQKKECVEYLQHSRIVLFCGDGANDVQALKAADVGLSLSDAEASIAAPFTSKYFEISCCLDLIKHGRAALVTSFGCFKYMAMYSITQFTTIIILRSLRSNLSDFQFMYIDIVLVLPLAITMAYSEPCSQLYPKKPQIELISHAVIIPLSLHFIFQGISQLVGFYWIQSEPFYNPSIIDYESKQFICYEGTTVFLISQFIYISYSFIFFTGKPYRLPIYRSKLYLLFLSISLLCSLGILFGIGNQLLLLEYLPFSFQLKLILYSIGFFTIAWVGDHYLFTFIATLAQKLLKGNKIE